MTKSRYRRLPGRKMGFLQCPSAWMAEDHILLVGGNRFQETYQRVYFRDLQALVIRRKGRIVFHWPYVFLVPALLFSMAGAVAGRLPGVLSVTVFQVSVLVAILLAVLFAARFGCHLYLITAVGNIPVPAVASTRTARRFTAKISPAVTTAQQPGSPT